jgi:hypothetical protein
MTDHPPVLTKPSSKRALEAAPSIPFEDAAAVFIGSLVDATDRTKALYSESLPTSR